VRRLALSVLAGPLAYARIAPARTFLFVLLVCLLTAVTQIGGLVLWFCVPAFIRLDGRLGNYGLAPRVAAAVMLFTTAYLAASLAVVPLAGAFGRVPLDCGLVGKTAYAPRSFLTCLFNRHYATMPARQALQEISVEFSADFGGSRVIYLDAGLPFFGWFPMIPHLSHGDGRKVDLALIYGGDSATPSPIGYWGFVQPRPGDPRPCTGNAGWLRWDMSWLQPLLPRAELDESRTAKLVHALAGSPRVKRILMESHLQRRLGLDHPKIRFQGCRAARHDDHIHVEF